MKRNVIIDEALGVAAAKRHRGAVDGDLTELEKLFVALADDYERLKSVLEAAEGQIKKYDEMLGEGVVTDDAVFNLDDLSMEGDIEVRVEIRKDCMSHIYRVKSNSKMVDITEVIKEMIRNDKR